MDSNVPIKDAFKVADDVLRQGVRGISDIITIPGMVNVDFADVRAIMTGAGSSLMGQGYGSGKDRAVQAALKATSSPLLDIGIEKVGEKCELGSISPTLWIPVFISLYSWT